MKIFYIRAMQKDIYALIKGYQKFREHYFDTKNPAFGELVRQGQRPNILMIACSDSRVDPAIIMNCKPGDLFVIRNVANLVPPYQDDHAYHGTSAALEFGISILGVQHVILFGHTQCGGIRSLLEHSHEKCGPKSFLTKWMEIARTAHDVVGENYRELPLEEKVHLCGQHSLVNSLNNLRTFPWIAERVEQGLLSLHAWNFDMAKGVLEAYDANLDRFRLIEGTAPQQAVA